MSTLPERYTPDEAARIAVDALNAALVAGPSELQPHEARCAVSTGLAALRRRLIERAVMCSSTKQEAIAKGWWHEAHETEVRREIWLRAADMAEEEISAANGGSEPRDPDLSNT